MDHQNICRLRCLTTSMLHILGGGLDAEDLLFTPLTHLGPQSHGFLLPRSLEIACVGRSYSGQSGYSKNRDQKVREKISGGGNMGCGTKESDFIGRARSTDNGE
ncbi:hypothetical protein TNCV_558891 [Trichonephila clavipes]|nr:hypothetical protein TNCV_558891 [Trichonephila clavipes]